MKSSCSGTRTLRTLSVAAMVAALGVAGLVPRGATAQVVDAGVSRVQLSDITVNVPALVLFEVGTVKTFDCPVAWGVRIVAESLATALGSGRLEVATAAGARRFPAAATQGALLDVLVNRPAERVAATRLIARLATDGNSMGGRTYDLVHSLKGLLHQAQIMDPWRPGWRLPTGLAVAVGAFNAYVDRSDPAFLAAPPDEFLLVQRVLSDMIIAALEHQGRAVSEASARGDYGLPCAPPPLPPPPTPPPPPPPPPPPERAIELCVMVDGAVQYVPAIVIPGTSDTVAVRQGERIPFARAYPDVGYAADSSWFKRRDRITVGRARYEPFGNPFMPSRTDVFSTFGAYQGIPLLVREGAGRDPAILYIPAAPRCTIQPYQKPNRVRKEP